MIEKSYHKNKFDGGREVGKWVSITERFLLDIATNDNNRLTTEDMRLLYLLMSRLEFNKDNCVEIIQRDLVTILGREKSGVSKSLKKLRDINIITKKEKKIYMFNPRYVFVNGTNNIHTYLKEYEKIEDEKFKTAREVQEQKNKEAKQKAKLREHITKQLNINDDTLIEELINKYTTSEEIENILKEQITQKIKQG